MTLIRMPAIFSGGAWHELFPTARFARGLIYESSFAKIEFADVAGGDPGLAETHGQAYGQEIQVSGGFGLVDVESAKLYEEEFEALLIGEDGKPLPVDVCEWIDTAGARLGTWRGCTLASAIRWATDQTIRRQTYDFTLRSPYPRRFASGTDNSVPSYDSAAYLGIQYRTSGPPAVTTGGTVYYMASQYVQLPVMFLGIVDEITGAANAPRLQRRVILSSQSAMRIKSIHIRNATPAASGGGTTTAKVADAAHDGTATAAIECSVGASETYCAPVAGAVTVAAGAPVYVYFPAAGGHADVEVILEVIPV